MSSAELKDNGEGRFSVSGALAFSSVPALWEQSRSRFMAVQSDRLEVDLNDVETVDSAGLALLVAWTRWAARRSKSVHFAHAPTQLIALAKANSLTGLLQLSDHRLEH